jgi:Spy/CpxP family protein refolding chaperone
LLKEDTMIAQMLLASSLAALPLTPLPGQDRHAQMHDRMVAMDTNASSDSFDVAQYAPPGGGRGGPMMGGQMGPMGPMGHGADGMHGPGMMHGLNLTEAQRDAMFNLHHAQAPQMREQMKALFKSRQALRELAQADNFDEQRASQIAAEMAKTESTIAMMRARTANAMWKLLTPEQRQQAAKMPFGGGMHGGPWGEGGGPGARGPR